MGYEDRCEFSDLLGQTLTGVLASDDAIHFYTNDSHYLMAHSQDCCEHVYVEDVNGDLKDLIGSPIVQAEEVSNMEDPGAKGDDDSYTWTFYRIATIKGSVFIRWYGTSNGYYSESVDFEKVSA